ncbi:MAG: ABC transporter [Betaproteobacteria bacterium]
MRHPQSAWELAVKNAYGFGKTVAMSYEQALEKVTAELQKEGFGVLTEIDVKATMKKKLDHDIPPYKILGACNPPFARRALEAEPTIGLLLPCNVVVRQDDGGAVHVEFMDPDAMQKLSSSPDLAKVAAEVRERLVRVMNAL